MSLTLDDAAVMARFDELCRLRGAQGHGLSLRDLAAAHALGRELEADTPDEGQIGDQAGAVSEGGRGPFVCRLRVLARPLGDEIRTRAVLRCPC
jgi:hypothetical protein